MKILVTGAAGFIGFHTVRALREKGYEIRGIDNLNDYYDVNLKKARLKELGDFDFTKGDIADTEFFLRYVQDRKIEKIIHLAAQAGVRYSLDNPYVYEQSNIAGFLNILEACRHNGIRHLIYASSSSVYGGNTKVPFAETDRVDNPVSLYATTKRANELMAETYNHLYNLPVTGLRFFTVYGPWGRPDMALFLFTKAILEGKPIRVFNNGNMQRDFTYIDDIVNGLISIVEKGPKQEKIYNIGCGSPVQLMAFIDNIEKQLGQRAEKIYMPMQQGDVGTTWADTTRLSKDYGYKPKIQIEYGIEEFLNWYRDYYEV